MIGTNTYFNFMGNAEEAMNFYKSVFGGEFTGFQRFGDMPGCERMPPEEQSQLMHITLTTAGGQVFMATDALKSMGHKLVFGNNSYTMLSTESEAETDRLFNGLSAGGKIESPLNKTFWGAYFGMFKDKFGVQWMINYNYPKKTI
jgi:PhnB protein